MSAWGNAWASLWGNSWGATEQPLEAIYGSLKSVNTLPYLGIVSQSERLTSLNESISLASLVQSESIKLASRPNNLNSTSNLNPLTHICKKSLDVRNN